MNKWQRAGAGVYGAIENALDDLRHNWERLWFDRKITGEVNVFPSIHQEQNTGEVFDKYFAREQESPVPEPGKDIGQDIER
jgi:hypothetical protein